MGFNASSLEICFWSLSLCSKIVNAGGKLINACHLGASEGTNLKLAVGPPGNLHDHVQYRLLLIGIEGDIVEGGNGYAIFFDVYTVVQGVGRPNLSNTVA